MISLPVYMSSLSLPSPLCMYIQFTMSCWAGRDQSLCCGTNVVFSRAALTAIGGWGVTSVTEDVLTSYHLTCTYSSALIVVVVVP